MNLSRLKKAITSIRLKRTVNNIGYSKSSIEAIEFIDCKHKFDIQVDKGDEYYVYDGPDAERDFCVYMLKIDRVFSRDQIDKLSNAMGYDVFEYTPGPIHPNGGPGGPECKHKWRRFRGKFIITGNVPKSLQIDALIRRNVFE